MKSAYWAISRWTGYARIPSRSIALILCGMMLLIVIINASHILSIDRQLRRAIKTAERASQAKTQFLSSMSHDIHS